MRSMGIEAVLPFATTAIGKMWAYLCLIELISRCRNSDHLLYVCCGVNTTAIKREAQVERISITFFSTMRYCVQKYLSMHIGRTLYRYIFDLYNTNKEAIDSYRKARSDELVLYIEKQYQYEKAIRGSKRMDRAKQIARLSTVIFE